MALRPKGGIDRASGYHVGDGDGSGNVAEEGRDHLGEQHRDRQRASDCRLPCATARLERVRGRLLPPLAIGVCPAHLPRRREERHCPIRGRPEVPRVSTRGGPLCAMFHDSSAERTLVPPTCHQTKMTRMSSAKSASTSQRKARRRSPNATNKSAASAANHPTQYNAAS